MKKLIIVLSIIAALALPLAVFAASANSPTGANIRNYCGIGVDPAKLTEQQKTDLSDAFSKMIELRKETINKMIANGTISAETGKLALERMDQMAQYGGLGMASPMMNGFGNGRSIKSQMMTGNGSRLNSPMMNNAGGNGMMNWNN